MLFAFALVVSSILFCIVFAIEVSTSLASNEVVITRSTFKFRYFPCTRWKRYMGDVGKPSPFSHQLERRMRQLLLPSGSMSMEESGDFDWDDDDWEENILLLSPGDVYSPSHNWEDTSWEEEYENSPVLSEVEERLTRAAAAHDGRYREALARKLRGFRPDVWAFIFVEEGAPQEEVDHLAKVYMQGREQSAHLWNGLEWGGAYSQLPREHRMSRIRTKWEVVDFPMGESNVEGVWIHTPTAHGPEWEVDSLIEAIEATLAVKGEICVSSMGRSAAIFRGRYRSIAMVFRGSVREYYNRDCCSDTDDYGWRYPTHFINSSHDEGFLNPREAEFMGVLVNSETPHSLVGALKARSIPAIKTKLACPEKWRKAAQEVADHDPQFEADWDYYDSIYERFESTLIPLAMAFGAYQDLPWWMGLVILVLGMVLKSKDFNWGLDGGDEEFVAWGQGLPITERGIRAKEHLYVEPTLWLRAFSPVTPEAKEALALWTIKREGNCPSVWNQLEGQGIRTQLPLVCGMARDENGLWTSCESSSTTGLTRWRWDTRRIAAEADSEAIIAAGERRHLGVVKEIDQDPIGTLEKLAKVSGGQYREKLAKRMVSIEPRSWLSAFGTKTLSQETVDSYARAKAKGREQDNLFWNELERTGIFTEVPTEFGLEKVGSRWCLPGGYPPTATNLDGVWIHTPKIRPRGWRKALQETLEIDGEICVSSINNSPEIFRATWRPFALVFQGKVRAYYDHDCWSVVGKDGRRIATERLHSSHDEGFLNPQEAEFRGILVNSRAPKHVVETLLASDYLTIIVDLGDRDEWVEAAKQVAEGHDPQFEEDWDLYDSIYERFESTLIPLALAYGAYQDLPWWMALGILVLGMAKVNRKANKARKKAKAASRNTTVRVRGRVVLDTQPEAKRENGSAEYGSHTHFEVRIHERLGVPLEMTGEVAKNLHTLIANAAPKVLKAPIRFGNARIMLGYPGLGAAQIWLRSGRAILRTWFPVGCEQEATCPEWAPTAEEIVEALTTTKTVIHYTDDHRDQPKVFNETRDRETYGVVYRVDSCLGEETARRKIGLLVNPIRYRMPATGGYPAVLGWDLAALERKILLQPIHDLEKAKRAPAFWDKPVTIPRENRTQYAAKAVRALVPTFSIERAALVAKTIQVPDEVWGEWFDQLPEGEHPFSSLNAAKRAGLNFPEEVLQAKGVYQHKDRYVLGPVKPFLNTGKQGYWIHATDEDVDLEKLLSGESEISVSSIGAERFFRWTEKTVLLVFVGEVREHYRRDVHSTLKDGKRVAWDQADQGFDPNGVTFWDEGFFLPTKENFLGALTKNTPDLGCKTLQIPLLNIQQRLLGVMNFQGSVDLDIPTTSAAGIYQWLNNNNMGPEPQEKNMHTTTSTTTTSTFDTDTGSMATWESGDFWEGYVDEESLCEEEGTQENEGKTLNEEVDAFLEAVMGVKPIDTKVWEGLTEAQQEALEGLDSWKTAPEDFSKAIIAGDKKEVRELLDLHMKNIPREMFLPLAMVAYPSTMKGLKRADKVRKLASRAAYLPKVTVTLEEDENHKLNHKIKYALGSGYEGLLEWAQATGAIEIPSKVLRMSLLDERPKAGVEGIPEAVVERLVNEGWTPLNRKHLVHKSAVKWLAETCFRKAVDFSAYAGRLFNPCVAGTLGTFKAQIRAVTVADGTRAGADGHGLIHPEHPWFKAMGIDDPRDALSLQIVGLNPQTGVFIKGIFVVSEKPEKDILWVDHLMIKGDKKDHYKALSKQWDAAVTEGTEEALVEETEFLAGVLAPMGNQSTKWCFQALEKVSRTTQTEEVIDRKLDAFFAGMETDPAKLAGRSKDPSVKLALAMAKKAGVNPLAVPIIRAAAEETLGRELYLAHQGAGGKGEGLIAVLDKRIQPGTCWTNPPSSKRLANSLDHDGDCDATDGPKTLLYRAGERTFVTAEGTLSIELGVHKDHDTFRPKKTSEGRLSPVYGPYKKGWGKDHDCDDTYVAVTRYPMLLPQALGVLKVVPAPEDVLVSGRVPKDTIWLSEEDLVSRMQGDTDGDRVILNWDRDTITLYRNRISINGDTDAIFQIEPQRQKEGLKAKALTMSPEGRAKVIANSQEGPMGLATLCMSAIFNYATVAAGGIQQALGWAVMTQECIDVKKHVVIFQDFKYTSRIGSWAIKEDGVFHMGTFHTSKIQTWDAKSMAKLFTEVNGKGAYRKMNWWRGGESDEYMQRSYPDLPGFKKAAWGGVLYDVITNKRVTDIKEYLGCTWMAKPKGPSLLHYNIAAAWRRADQWCKNYWSYDGPEVSVEQLFEMLLGDTWTRAKADPGYKKPGGLRHKSGLRDYQLAVMRAMNCHPAEKEQRIGAAYVKLCEDLERMVEQRGAGALLTILKCEMAIAEEALKDEDNTPAYAALMAARAINRGLKVVSYPGSPITEMLGLEEDLESCTFLQGRLGDIKRVLLSFEKEHEMKDPCEAAIALLYGDKERNIPLPFRHLFSKEMAMHHCETCKTTVERVALNLLRSKTRKNALGPVEEQEIAGALVTGFRKGDAERRIRYHKGIDLLKRLDSTLELEIPSYVTEEDLNKLREIYLSKR